MHTLLLAALLAQVAPGMPSLDYFLGTWQCNGSFPSTGKAIASTMHFERDLGGAAIVKHHDDTPPNTYHAVEAWNYSAKSQIFNGALTDNFGGVRLFTSDGWHGNILTWSSGPGVAPIQQFVGDTLTCTRNGAQ